MAKSLEEQERELGREAQDALIMLGGALRGGQPLSAIKPLFAKAQALGAEGGAVVSLGYEPVSINGCTALICAAEWSPPDVVEWLSSQLDKSAMKAMDDRGRTPLRAALLEGRFDNAQALWNAGAPFASTPYNEGAIHSLATSSAEGLRLLAGWGVDLGVVDADDGTTPLISATRSRQDCRVENIALLISLGVDLDVKSANGLTARDHLAARLHFPRGAEALEILDSALLAKSLAASLAAAPKAGPKAL